MALQSKPGVQECFQRRLSRGHQEDGKFSAGGAGGAATAFPLPALAQGSDIHNIDLDQLLGLVAVLLKPVGCAGWDRSLVASSNQTPQ